MKNLVKKINELNIIFGKEKNKLTIERRKMFYNSEEAHI